MMPMTIYL